MQFSSLGIGPPRHGQEGLVTSWPLGPQILHRIPQQAALQRTRSSSVGFANQVTPGYADGAQICVPSPRRAPSPRQALLPSPRQESLSAQLQVDATLRVRPSVTMESPRRYTLVEVPCQSLTKTGSSQGLATPPHTPQVPLYQGRSSSASSSRGRVAVHDPPAPSITPAAADDACHHVPLTRVSLQDLAGIVEDLSRVANIPCLAEQHVIEAVKRLSAARTIADYEMAGTEVIRHSSSASCLSKSRGTYRLFARNAVCRFADATSTWILRAVFASWLSSLRELDCVSPLASAFDDSAHLGGATRATSMMSSHQFTPTFSNSPSLQHRLSDDDLSSAEVRSSFCRSAVAQRCDPVVREAAPRRDRIWRTRLATWVDKSAVRIEEEACCRCFSAWRRDTDKLLMMRSVTASAGVRKELKAMQDASRIRETTTLQEEAMLRIDQKFSLLQEKVSSWTAKTAQRLAIVLAAALLSGCIAYWRCAVSVRRVSERCDRAAQVDLRTSSRERVSRMIARHALTSELAFAELCLRSWYHEVVRIRSINAHEQQLMRVTKLEETLADFELVKAEALATRSAALSAELSGTLVEQCNKAAHEAARQCRSSNAIAVGAYCWRKAIALERRSLSVILSVWLIEVCSSAAVKMQQASSAAAEANLKHQLQETSHQLEKARTADWELRTRFDQRRADMAKRFGRLRIAARIHRYFAAWSQAVELEASLQVKALRRAQDTWRNDMLARSAFSAWRQYARCTGLLLRRWRAHSLVLVRVILDVWRFSVVERCHSSSGPSTPTHPRKLVSRFMPVTDSVSTATSLGSSRKSNSHGSEPPRRDSSRKEVKQMIPRQTPKSSSAASLNSGRASSREASLQRSSRKSEPTYSRARSDPELPHTVVHLKDLCLAEIHLDDESSARGGHPAPRRPTSQGFVSTPRRGHQRPSGHVASHG